MVFIKGKPTKFKEKPCKVCKKQFSPHSGNDMFCSPNCTHVNKLAYKKLWYKRHAKRIYEKYLPYKKKHAIGRQIAYRLVKQLGVEKKCQVCFSDYVVDIHHKDKNTSNNSLENLQLLCRYCHTRVHQSLTNIL